MLKKILLPFLLISCISLTAQDSSKVTLSGSIKDAETGEALIGATVLAKAGVGAIADLDGNFSLKLSKGDYSIEVSMLGYRKFSQKVKLYANKNIDVKLENTVLDEVEVVADIAQIRETPVAFSSISATKIQEELGGKDISMIANITPGAYATSQGGGLGDSRVTIRGFDQRNIGVLVDGIPVNDMENGQVYWSNWTGLTDIIRSMQIQRGLGASKLAISSVGGTMNYITNGIENKRQLVAKKEWGNNGYNVMALSYNSGLINNKWGFTLAGTYKTGNGWVEGTWFNAYSYFAKIQYMFNPRNTISIGINGAPQSHGQRSTKMQIAVYDRAYAEKLGVNADSVLREFSTTGIKYTTLTQGDRDLRWNPDQILLDKKTVMNDRVNFFHKPLININYFSKLSEKTNLSTVAYASYGKGGGTSYAPSSPNSRDSITGYYAQSTYTKTNLMTSSVAPGEIKSTSILRASNNNHNWYGLLSTATSKLNKMFTLTYGVDLRYYQGFHNNTVYELFGGNYFYETTQNPVLDYKNQNNFVRRKDDVYGTNYNGYVKWGGLFGQVEFKKDKWAAFFTATGSKQGYNRVDFYKKKDLLIGDAVFNQMVRSGETFFYNGTDQVLAVRGSTITTSGDTTLIKQDNSAKPAVKILNATGYTIDSKEARYATTGWKWQEGYTLKTGANYNINDHHNVFANVGIMQIPQRFDNTFNFSNKLITGFKPQYIQSYELGYGIKYSKLYGSMNAYYTSWKNQPQPSRSDPDGNLFVSNGIDATYKGIEFEGNFKPIKQIEIDAAISFGDWIYDSGGIIYSYDTDNNLNDSVQYDAKGVHIGNAAQNQISLGVKYSPIKGAYIKPRIIRFDKNYANFNALDLNNYSKDPVTKQVIDNRGRDSWKLPAYYLFDISAGYEIPFKEFKVNIFTTVSNVLNLRYISDAQNNGASQSASGFDATSASVFFGVGRTYTFGTKLTF